ncbi:hypothetical protein V5O39_06330 [Pseudomonas parakoreensis]
MVILCRHQSRNHCYELFPLQGLCRKSDRLAEAFASGHVFNEDTASFDGATNGKNGNFPRLTYLENIITEHAAYFQGATPSQSEQADINKLLPRRHWELANTQMFTSSACCLIGLVNLRHTTKSQPGTHRQWKVTNRRG